MFIVVFSNPLLIVNQELPPSRLLYTPDPTVSLVGVVPCVAMPVAAYTIDESEGTKANS